MKEKFDLINKTYYLEDFDQAMQECKRYIDTVGHLNIIVDDDLSYKICKDSRAKLRKKQKEIASKRLQINDIILGEFNNQVKDVEKLLKDEPSLPYTVPLPDEAGSFPSPGKAPLRLLKE